MPSDMVEILTLVKSYKLLKNLGALSKYVKCRQSLTKIKKHQTRPNRRNLRPPRSGTPANGIIGTVLQRPVHRHPTHPDQSPPKPLIRNCHTLPLSLLFFQTDGSNKETVYKRGIFSRQLPLNAVHFGMGWEKITTD
jgi:hypothetical protein